MPVPGPLSNPCRDAGPCQNSQNRPVWTITFTNHKRCRESALWTLTRRFEASTLHFQPMFPPRFFPLLLPFLPSLPSEYSNSLLSAHKVLGPSPRTRPFCTVTSVVSPKSSGDAMWLLIQDARDGLGDWISTACPCPCPFLGRSWHLASSVSYALLTLPPSEGIKYCKGKW